MIFKSIKILSIGLATLVCLGLAEAEQTEEPKQSTETEPRLIDWEHLIPASVTRAEVRKGTILGANTTFGLQYDPAFFPPVKELDGKLIRMAGFSLPLEFKDDKVISMLLVPYVGACIHVPPPIPLQIVYVTTEEPYNSRSLYDAIWVTGTMHIDSSSYELDYVDGREDILTGYSLKVEKIEPYNPAEKKN